jgi:hypothetical protein
MHIFDNDKCHSINKIPMQRESVLYSVGIVATRTCVTTNAWKETCSATILGLCHWLRSFFDLVRLDYREKMEKWKIENIREANGYYVLGDPLPPSLPSSSIPGNKSEILLSGCFNECFVTSTWQWSLKNIYGLKIIIIMDNNYFYEHNFESLNQF